MCMYMYMYMFIYICVYICMRVCAYIQVSILNAPLFFLLLNLCAKCLVDSFVKQEGIHSIYHVIVREFS